MHYPNYVREKEAENKGEGVQGGHIIKHSVELFTMIMVMQLDELENPVKENRLAVDLSLLNSHPET